MLAVSLAWHDMAWLDLVCLQQGWQCLPGFVCGCLGMDEAGAQLGWHQITAGFNHFIFYVSNNHAEMIKSHLYALDPCVCDLLVFLPEYFKFEFCKSV